MTNPDLKSEIFNLVRKYYQQEHQRPPFEPGKTRITYAGRVYDEREMINLVDAALQFWLTAGPYAVQLEQQLTSYYRAAGCFLVNSGSSANLIMISALCAPGLTTDLNDFPLQPMQPGDEVITPAVTFPTTLTPIVQHGLIPLFIDCEVGTYNINPALLEDAIGPRTRAIFVPHTLGIPCDMDIIMDVAKRHQLWVIEDGCDAMGAAFNGRLVGSFGAMSSLSFFPAHHITMGEGGGVVVNETRLLRTAMAMRDWGRSCWCAPGKNNSCGHRFSQQKGELPFGYDHKYIYDFLGYNLKITDMQAAIGLAQFEKIGDFVQKRRDNFQFLNSNLADLEEFLILPRIDPRANPSPFGFPMTVKQGIDRNSLVQHLEASNIETRLVFGGNILRQPGFLYIPRRIHGVLEDSDTIMRNTLFVGVYPGMSPEMLEYMVEQIHAYFRKL